MKINVENLIGKHKTRQQRCAGGIYSYNKEQIPISIYVYISRVGVILLKVRYKGMCMVGIG